MSIAKRYERLIEAAKTIRYKSLDMARSGGSEGAHLGTAYSMAELMSCIFMDLMNHGPEKVNDPGHDRFILSKGHGCLPYYILLQQCGYFEEELLSTFEQMDSMLAGHPVAYPEVGVEFSTGSLGHGLPIATGVAAAHKNLGTKAKVFVSVGDGETNEGSIWESAMFAAHNKLDNLYVVIDRNHQQSDGASAGIMELGNLADKWKAFGWEVCECDGHNVEEIIRAFEDTGFKSDKPFVLIGHTVKGKGVSFFEDNPAWHHNVLSEAQYNAAIEELNGYYGG